MLPPSSALGHPQKVEESEEVSRGMVLPQGTGQPPKGTARAGELGTQGLKIIFRSELLTVDTELS